MENKLHLLGDQEREDIQAVSESSLLSQHIYLFLKQNQNTENKIGCDARLGSELFVQDLALCSLQRIKKLTF